ncbi:hypothetical protein Tco_1198102, partial [Tanacetum coccineum]
DEVQGAHVEEKKMDKEAINEEEEGNALYRDVNVNLEGRDVEMTDAQQTNVQTTQVVDDTHVILTAPINPEDVPVTTIAEPPLMSVTTLLPPFTHLITHMQQTLVPTPTSTQSSSLQDLPNFGSLFEFNQRLKTLENDFSEFRQTNQFAKAVYSIPGIIDNYLANKMNKAVKTAIQLQSDKVKDEAFAENEAFINSLDDNMKKIIKEQVKQQVKKQVSKILPRIEKTANEQLEVEVMTRLSTESKTSHAVAANLSELELKKILIDKMESNKSIHKSDEQKNLYKELVEAYESDKLILDTYGDTISFKRRRDDEDKDEEPSAGSDQERTSINQCTKGKDIQDIWQKEDLRESFNELIDTPLDFSAFVMNRLKVDTLTPELLADLTFELMKGSCKSLIELEYLFEEVYKATTDKLDWINPESQQYPHDLQKPLPLIPNSRGRHVIHFDHFINNDLEYLSGGVSSQKYATSVTKTKAADYRHIKWIEDFVPNRMWSQVLISYDKHALWGISHWGRKRQQFYAFAASRESAKDVYSKRRIIVVTKLEIVEWHNYKNLDWITVRRDDDKLYKFKEGDFNKLRIQDIKDMLLLLVQGKLTNLKIKERLAFNVSLRMITKSVVIQRRVEDLQLGVESYQKKLNLTKPDTYRPDLKRREADTTYSRPRGFIYQNKDKKNRLMRINELYKFSDGTLDDVRTALNDHLKGFQMEYLPHTIWRQRDKDNA